MARSIANRLEHATRTTRTRRTHCPACKGPRSFAFLYNDGNGAPDPPPCARCGRPPRLVFVFAYVDEDGNVVHASDEEDDDGGAR